MPDSASSNHGVHNSKQTAFRLPEPLKKLLKDTAERQGETMTDIVTRAVETELNRTVKSVDANDLQRVIAETITGEPRLRDGSIDPWHTAEEIIDALRDAGWMVVPRLQEAGTRR